MGHYQSIRLALAHYGSAAALSRVIGLTPQGVSKRNREGRGLSAEECYLVHRDAGIPLSKLRPDLWGRKVIKEVSRET